MSSLEDYDVQLELKERLNYTEHIEKALNAIDNALNNERVSLTKVKILILNLMYKVPSTWYDKEFTQDIKDVIIQKKVPNRQTWAGVKLSTEYMENHNMPLRRDIVDVDYFSLKHAIINLLDRRNMLVRKDKIEMSTGKNLEFETLDDLIEELGENEE